MNLHIAQFLRIISLSLIVTTYSAQLQFSIQDTAALAPMPARVHLRAPNGEPVRAPGFPFFRDHFVCTGRVTVALAPGNYSYEIERGPEYSTAAGSVMLGESGTNIAVRLSRLAHLSEEGWWSGELHVHRPIQDISLLMRAEDLHFAPVISWWNTQNYWRTNPIPQNLLVPFDANRFYHLMGGEDEREGGALLYFNLREPLSITGAGREYPSPMQFLTQALESARQNELVHIDIEKPFWWDVPIWLASGHVHTVGIANNHMNRARMYEDEAWGKPRDKTILPNPLGNGFWTQEIYYHILNSGLRIPPSAGSASGVLPNPVGYNRVYVHLEGEPTWEKWWKGLRAGRSFVSNGPLLRCTANDQIPGHIFRADRSGPFRLSLKGTLTTRDPKGVIEIIQNGQVIRSVPFTSSNETFDLGDVEFRESSWLLVRTIADVPNTFRFASSAPFYIEFPDRPKRISKTSAEFFLNWTRERMGRVKVEDSVQLESVLRHHQAAEKFWKDAVARASAP